LKQSSDATAPRTLIHVADEGLLTSRDVAQRLGVSNRTVARWVREGKLRPEYVTPGGQSRFRWEDVRRQLGLPSRD
jgi:excisionase family DNA binding protein